MKLHDEWKGILRKAWSIRLIILAGLFSGFEIILPFLPELLPVPRGAFAALSFVATGGAFIARLVAQQSISQKDQSP